jgi:hypothetical protein
MWEQSLGVAQNVIEGAQPVTQQKWEDVRSFVHSHQLVHLWAASVNESNHLVCLLFLKLFFLSLQ